MANIQQTEIGTSNPASICKGVPLIPAMGALKLGVDGTKTLWSTHPTILALKLDLDVSFSYFFGLCGPGWGIYMKVEGNTAVVAPNDVKLTVTEDQLTAGLILGAAIGLKFDISSQYYGCWISNWNWWGPSISCGWRTGLDVSPTLNLDILKLAYEAAKLILGKKPELEETNKPEDVMTSPIAMQSYGISDFQENTFGDNNGLLNATPVFSIPINIWSLLVNMDKSSGICAGSAVALNTTLKAAHISVGFGPSFGLAFPVDVKMHEIYLDNVLYDNLTFSGAEVTGTTAGVPPLVDITNINIKFSESPGIDFYFGIFASVSAFEVFSFSYETGWGLLDIFGIRASLGPYYFDMAATAGQPLNKACTVCGVNNGFYEVIFE